MKLVALLALLVGCAKGTTSISTIVDVEPAVAPILLLRTSVAKVSDPAHVGSGAIRSQTIGDALDRPAAFVFPLLLPIAVDQSFAGAVTVTVEGLDWDTHEVIASGSATAEVVLDQKAQAMLTLAPVALPADGGAEGGAQDGADGT